MQNIVKYHLPCTYEHFSVVNIYKISKSTRKHLCNHLKIIGYVLQTRVPDNDTRNKGTIERRQKEYSRKSLTMKSYNHFELQVYVDNFH